MRVTVDQSRCQGHARCGRCTHPDPVRPGRRRPLLRLEPIRCLASSAKRHTRPRPGARKRRSRWSRGGLRTPGRHAHERRDEVRVAPPGAPVFCAAHMFDSWDERPRRLPSPSWRRRTAPVRPDGTLVVAARQNMTEFLRHPAVRATDGVHFNLGGKRPLIRSTWTATRPQVPRAAYPLFTPKQVARLEPAIPRQDQRPDRRVRGRGLGRPDGQPVRDRCRRTCSSSCSGCPPPTCPSSSSSRRRWSARSGRRRRAAGEHAAAGDRMYDYLTTVLSERRAAPPRDDLIGGFLTTELDGERLTDQEIVDICYLLVIAGLDTVTSSLSCLLAWFAEHPDERRQVVADPGQLPRVIEELMRFESPVPLGHRWVTEDIEIRGRRLPGRGQGRGDLGGGERGPERVRRPADGRLRASAQRARRIRGRAASLPGLEPGPPRAAPGCRGVPPAHSRL